MSTNDFVSQWENNHIIVIDRPDNNNGGRDVEVFQPLPLTTDGPIRLEAAANLKCRAHGDGGQ
jgi:hypothetical protein